MHDVIQDPMLRSNLDVKGRVRIHQRDISKSGLKTDPYLVEDTNNLIVYRGRNWLMQRAFAKDMTNRTDWSDKWITWLGIGVGGAVGGSPLVPTDPDLIECTLDTHGVVSAGSRWVTVNGLDYHQFDTGYPLFLNDPEIVQCDPRGGALPSGCVDLCNDCSATDPIDTETYNCDKFLVALTRTTISSEECNGGTGPLDYQDINEAGLFVSPSDNKLYSFASDDIQLFARVCFSTIRKDVNRELIFSWYVYF